MSSRRSHVDGITIGFANEVRAAPALEAVLATITYGSKDRRKLAKAVAKRRNGRDSMNPICQLPSLSTFSNDQSGDLSSSNMDPNACNHRMDLQKSNITVITLSPQDFTGLDASGETDAAQGLFQSLTRIEWKGNGDYMSFASRAHNQWKEFNRFEDQISHVSDPEVEGDAAASFMVVLFLIAVLAYVVEHYSAEVENVAIWLLRRLLA